LGQPYAETPSLLQGDDSPVTWSLVRGPVGMTIDPGSGEVSWPSPGPADTIHSVTIRAENAVGEHEQLWQITVNAPPVIDDVPDRTVARGRQYTETLELLQGKNVPVTWTLRQSPSGMVIDAETGEVTWANPTPAEAVRTVRVRATNDQGYDEESWQVTIKAPPLIEDIDDETIPAEELYAKLPKLIEGTDLAVTWSLRSAPEGMSINAQTGVVTWPEPKNELSPATVTVRADAAIGSDEETWVLTILPPNVEVEIGIEPGNDGLRIAVDGVSYIGAQVFRWPEGSAHEVWIPSPQTGTSGAAYRFESWDDGGPVAMRTIVADSAGTYTATMRELILTELVVMGPREIQEGRTAQYSARLVRSDGNGEDVTSLATWQLSSSRYAEIDAGLVTTSEVDSNRAFEIYVTFKNDDVSLLERVSVTIVNVPQQVMLTVFTEPASGQPRQTTHDVGETVTVAVPAPPAAGFTFMEWQGDAAGTNDPLRIAMNTDKNVTAVFQASGSTVPCTALPTSVVLLLACLLGFHTSRRR
jgi:hypothetical protein